MLVVPLGLLTTCKKLCDTTDAPVYTLTPGQQAWTKPFGKDNVWRFGNANGYVRPYRITRAQTVSEGAGGGKSTPCFTYFNESFIAELERTDSVGYVLERTVRFQLTPANAADNAPLDAVAFLGSSRFWLPIARAEEGQLPLLPATFTDRTYPAVLQSAYAPLPPQVPRPTSVKRVFFTKADGLIRFEEFGGTVWNRL
ncbi:hypothetical protein [Hymenobacter terrenus]|uniref:hypothetical protein n=1 Tax=Hymenobacter terrenus TaxID=1629124 RepID=UPI0012E07C92|nr:hypothetical protein [Hymenobacter terrenus]